MSGAEGGAAEELCSHPGGSSQGASAAAGLALLRECSRCMWSCVGWLMCMRWPGGGVPMHRQRTAVALLALMLCWHWVLLLSAVTPWVQCSSSCSSCSLFIRVLPAGCVRVYVAYACYVCMWCMHEVYA